MDEWFGNLHSRFRNEASQFLRLHFWFQECLLSSNHSIEVISAPNCSYECKQTGWLAVELPQKYNEIPEPLYYLPEDNGETSEPEQRFFELTSDRFESSWLLHPRPTCRHPNVPLFYSCSFDKRARFLNNRFLGGLSFSVSVKFRTFYIFFLNGAANSHFFLKSQGKQNNAGKNATLPNLP